jgi:histidinol-phosphate aminotransferase
MPYTHDLPINPHLLNLPRYIRGRSIEEIQRQLGVPDIIKLGSNECLYGPSPRAIEAIRKMALQAHYYPGVEAHDLREQLAAQLGHDFTAENIIIGNGSADVLRAIAQTFVFDRVESIIQMPAFQMYEILTDMYGGRPVVLRQTDSYEYDLDEMCAHVTPKTRLLFFNNPNNPTGLYVRHAALTALLDRLPPHVIVVLDEAYADFAEASDFPNALEYVRDGRNVIATRTFSKLYGLAGLRVGYGIARPDLIDALLRTQTAFHVGTLPLLAAAAALTDHDHVRRALEVNHDGKAYLYREFEALGLEYLPTEANFIMLVNLPFPVTAIERVMHTHGVILRPCEPFGLPDALRITIAPPEINERMIHALRETLAELEKG